MSEEPEDIKTLAGQLQAITEDARSLITNLGEPCGCWRGEPGTWSVSECLEHLAISNNAYLSPMNDAACRGRAQRKFRKGPATPGVLGSLFARSLEPPVRPLLKSKSPSRIRPTGTSTLNGAFTEFMASHSAAIRFLNENADLDLEGLLFPNPLVRGLRFSLASGLQILAAHERRHLWQAWDVRRSAESRA